MFTTSLGSRPRTGTAGRSTLTGWTCRYLSGDGDDTSRRIRSSHIKPLPLPDNPAAAAAARRHLTRALSGWPPDAQDTAVLLVSELVSNAIQHEAPPVTLTIHLTAAGDRVRVEVGDANPLLPPAAAHDYSTTGERGRGLQIIQALATASGSRATDNADVARRSAQAAARSAWWAWAR